MAVRNYAYPPDKRDALLSYLLKFKALKTNRELNVPRVLAIVGPGGTGKTSMVKRVAAEEGLPIEVLHGGSLSGIYSGQSSIPVRQAILRLNASQSPGILLLDDFDMSDARQEEGLSGTVSRVALQGLVQGWGDDPFTVHMSDDPEKPRPVHLDNPPALIITANNTGVFQDTMLRDMRAELLELDPKGEELLPIVGAMYPHLPDREVKALVKTFPTAKPAFFRMLSNGKANAVLQRHIRNCEKQGVSVFAYDIADALTMAIEAPSLFELVDEGKRLAACPRGKDYLQHTDEKGKAA